MKNIPYCKLICLSNKNKCYNDLIKKNLSSANAFHDRLHTSVNVKDFKSLIVWQC